MTQITVDFVELDALGRLYDTSQQELSGIIEDIQRRLLSIDWGQLVAYGISPATWFAEMDEATNRLTDDTFRLAQGTSELRQYLLQAFQGDSGALGPYAAALPDLWWWQAGAPLGGPWGSGPMAAAGSATGSPTDQQIVATAEQWIGVPYLWGGGHGAVVAPRGVEVDCSGLVHEVYGENGINIGGTAATLYASTTHVADLAQAMPGDLLFFGSPGDIVHVAIYIGDGKMIEAPQTGAWVHETDVRTDFVGIGRVLSG